MVRPDEPLDLAEIAGNGDVYAGDFLQVCGDGPTQLTVVDLPTNTLMGTWSFDLQPCS